MPRLRARLPARATVARQIAGYWSGDHRSRRGDEDVQYCYSHSWRIALLERFWQARHPPRYAAYLTPSSPRFRLSSFWRADHGGHEVEVGRRAWTLAQAIPGSFRSQGAAADVSALYLGIDWTG